MKTIFRTKFGSHLYGTETNQSDTDWKSIHLPDEEEILLQRVREVIGGKSKTGDGIKNSPEDVDDESYSLQKYLQLISQGQTVAIDMLFSPIPEIETDLWKEIKENKEKLLTKKSAAFVGYVKVQAGKYGIKGSRVSAAKEVTELFDRAVSAYGPLAKVMELDGKFPIGEHSRVVEKETSPGKYETYFECCNRMVGFKNTLKEAAHIYKRIFDEYGERARLAESNEGIDWKALSHAVRVGTEALELLSTGKITFPCYNAEHLLKIKKGEVLYKEVAKEIEELLDTVEQASKISVLRSEPDYGFIDELVKREYKGVICG